MEEGSSLPISPGWARLGTAEAGILGEADSAVGQEAAGVDLADGLFNQLAELPLLLGGDVGLEVLDFRQVFADEHHQSHVGQAADPGVAEQRGSRANRPSGSVG